jgi:hypothetical protein
MNYQRKKAAVTKYLPLSLEGKTEQEIKDAIALDEKKFTPEEVEEIFQAILNPEPAALSSKYKVNYGVYIPEQAKEFTKEEIEADQDIIDYLVEIKSGAVSIIKEAE